MAPFIDLHTHSKGFISSEVLAIKSIDLCTQGADDIGEQPVSVGLHPWHIEQATLQKLLYLLEHYAQQENILMLGEIGLDRNSRVDMELQKSAFEMQCQIAYQHHLPCILHIVKAWEELFATQKRLGREQPLFIIHGFRGKPDLAKSLIDKGFYLSFGSHYSQESLLVAWQAHHLFLETDEAELSIATHYQQVAEMLEITSKTLRETIFEQGAELLPLLPYLLSSMR